MLPQGHVDGAETAANGSGDGAFECGIARLDLSEGLRWYEIKAIGERRTACLGLLDLEIDIESGENSVNGTDNFGSDTITRDERD